VNQVQSRPTDFIGTTWWHRPCSAW
jgi:hypothetical protein